MVPPPNKETVEQAVWAQFASRAPRSLVLAVSGGRDSMSLLHAVASVGLADLVASVAVFDHRTGRASSHAAESVVSAARERGLPVLVGSAKHPMHNATEAEWRIARWSYLRGVARQYAAHVVTAHTQDDHVETIAHRLWRGGGPRGLAGLDVDAGPLRPFLRVTRASVAAYAAEHGLAVVDDPSNQDRRHARVRWRLDLLPAMRRVRPEIDAELLAVGTAAAAWRRSGEALVREYVCSSPSPMGVLLDLSGLNDVPAQHLAWLWPAILAPHGVVVDRRGLARLGGRIGSGGRVPLAGGAEVVRLAGGQWVLRRTREAPAPRPLAAKTPFGPWRIHRTLTEGDGDENPWHARLPADIDLVVRAWLPGDRLVGPAGPRRVKRWLAEAGIPGPLREGWPVVAVGANVWWIIGVRQAVAPLGTPTLHYACERRFD